MKDPSPSWTIYWGGMSISCFPHETIASALRRHGVLSFEEPSATRDARYFCGIGRCQNCVVMVDGEALVEACITPVKNGMTISTAIRVYDDAGC